MNIKGKIQKHILLTIFLTILLTSITASAASLYLGNNKHTTGILDVDIYPREVKLYFGETKQFVVAVNNGTPPVEVKWYSNSTYYASGIAINFSFEKPCRYTILSVQIKDSLGNFGTDSIWVYDPISFSTIVEAGSMVTEASYIVFKDGSVYYGRNGITGEIQYSGTDFSTIAESCLGQFYSVGGTLWIRDPSLITSPIDIPNGSKCISVKGGNGLGKSYAEHSVYTGTHLKSTCSVMFQTAYTNDKRSVFGLKFEDIKFEGPDTDESIAIYARNVDGLIIEDCFFLRLGYAVWFDYMGTTYPIAEQPGYLRVKYCAFSEGRTEAIKIVRSTQNDVSHNIFWGFGPYNRYLNFTGSDKTNVVCNEFDYDSSVKDITEDIYLKSISGYKVTGIEIQDNWACRNASFPFIRTAGIGQEIYDVLSEGNIIYHNYSPNIDTDSGPYIIGDLAYHQLNARDHINPFSSQFGRLKDQTSTWTAGVTRQNVWSPMTIMVTVTVPNGGTAEILMDYDNTVWSVMSVANNLNANEKFTMTAQVPTLYYWRVNVAGGASLTSITVTFW